MWTNPLHCRILSVGTFAQICELGYIRNPSSEGDPLLASRPLLALCLEVGTTGSTMKVISVKGEDKVAGGSCAEVQRNEDGPTTASAEPALPLA